MQPVNCQGASRSFPRRTPPQPLAQLTPPPTPPTPPPPPTPLTPRRRARPTPQSVRSRPLTPPQLLPSLTYLLPPPPRPVPPSPPPALVSGQPFSRTLRSFDPVPSSPTALCGPMALRPPWLQILGTTSSACCRKVKTGTCGLTGTSGPFSSLIFGGGFGIPAGGDV